MGATYIAILGNFCDKEIKAENLEDKNDETCAKMSLDTATNLSFPWATSEAAYNSGKKLTISVRDGDGWRVVYWMWENNNTIYICAADNWSKGEKVAGANTNNGYWKALQFTSASNGGYSIKLVDIKVDK